MEDQVQKVQATFTSQNLHQVSGTYPFRLPLSFFFSPDAISAQLRKPTMWLVKSVPRRNEFAPSAWNQQRLWRLSHQSQHLVKRNSWRLKWTVLSNRFQSVSDERSCVSWRRAKRTRMVKPMKQVRRFRKYPYFLAKSLNIWKFRRFWRRERDGFKKASHPAQSSRFA